MLDQDRIAELERENAGLSAMVDVLEAKLAEREDELGLRIANLVAELNRYKQMAQPVW